MEGQSLGRIYGSTTDSESEFNSVDTVVTPSFKRFNGSNEKVQIMSDSDHDHESQMSLN